MHYIIYSVSIFLSYLAKRNALTIDGFIHTSFTVHFVGRPQPGRPLYEQERYYFFHKGCPDIIPHRFRYSGIPSYVLSLFPPVSWRIPAHTKYFIIQRPPQLFW